MKNFKKNIISSLVLALFFSSVSSELYAAKKLLTLLMVAALATNQATQPDLDESRCTIKVINAGTPHERWVFEESERSACAAGYAKFEQQFSETKESRQAAKQLHQDVQQARSLTNKRKVCNTYFEDKPLEIVEALLQSYLSHEATTKENIDSIIAAYKFYLSEKQPGLSSNEIDDRVAQCMHIIARSRLGKALEVSTLKTGDSSTAKTTAQASHQSKDR